MPRVVINTRPFCAARRSIIPLSPTLGPKRSAGTTGCCGRAARTSSRSNSSSSSNAVRCGGGGWDRGRTTTLDCLDVFDKLDDLGPDLAREELVASSIGMHAVALEHGVGVAVGARAVGDDNGGLRGRVLSSPAWDGLVHGLDGGVRPACGDKLVDL